MTVLAYTGFRRRLKGMEYAQPAARAAVGVGGRRLAGAPGERRLHDQAGRLGVA